jgi:PIN domain nuclease of toxin-antitoxin system
VKYLLDTHTLLWWILNDAQLSPPCRGLIEDGANTIYFSAASAWEIAIKSQIGKLPLPEPPDRFLPERLKRHGFTPMPISVGHALRTYTLPLHHRDPFDRILVAQSEAEDAPILTADSLISQYGVRTIW